MPSPSRGVGDRPHRITLQNPGPAVPDGDGNYTQTWSDLAPASVSAAIEPATASKLERISAGTVSASATHIVTIPYHPQVTTRTRLLIPGARVLNVTGLMDPDERHVDLILTCEEAR